MPPLSIYRGTFENESGGMAAALQTFFCSPSSRGLRDELDSNVAGGDDHADIER